jgi:hypothetical protein
LGCTPPVSRVVTRILLLALFCRGQGAESARRRLADRASAETPCHAASRALLWIADQPLWTVVIGLDRGWPINRIDPEPLAVAYDAELIPLLGGGWSARSVAAASV